ncbi:DNA cytosine methyltransferase [Curtobacterium sp. 8I-2]|uniref:DNA cytosine methyltransferase n=1 Tax=Curtobacterium sp. 8I-2 TaxID=2653136 RepID=UPI0012F0BEA7|nr:DNA cytosine methyltransferase [Curtobacterium sp. 8I-2]VXA97521.1 DNA (Cytosine-5-)-methyltransferase [Curtobacterium sp. 8I-2]
MQNIVAIDSARPKVLEFFAGIGLARLGLETTGFRVAWANDYEPAKQQLYNRNFGAAASDHFTLGDIGDVDASELPSDTDLAWGSSPCTDLSLAGSRGGIRAGESNAFWHYIRLLEDMGETRPRVAVLENVVGLATSHGGDDLAAAIRAFNDLGYSVDVLTIDARRFVPQSRPRLFLVATTTPPPEQDVSISELRPAWLHSVFADNTLRTHRAPLAAPPPIKTEGFGATVEAMDEDDARWWNDAKVSAFLQSLSAVQGQRVQLLRESTSTSYRTAYRRTRNGIPTWEVRPDDISGCLRTARGGSSKQAVVRFGNGRIKIRWMTPLEYARLMGAPDFDLIEARTNQALFAFGDAVAVPVVAWLAQNYLLPLVREDLEKFRPSSEVQASPTRTLSNGFHQFGVSRVQ